MLQVVIWYNYRHKLVWCFPCLINSRRNKMKKVFFRNRLETYQPSDTLNWNRYFWLAFWQTKHYFCIECAINNIYISYCIYCISLHFNKYIKNEHIPCLHSIKLCRIYTIIDFFFLQKTSTIIKHDTNLSSTDAIRTGRSPICSGSICRSCSTRPDT